MTDLPWSGMGGVILATIIVLAIIVIWGMFKELRSGFPLKDERTQKISGKAAYYAFHLGCYFMIALLLLNILSIEFRGVHLLDGWYALNFSIIVQSLMYLGFRYYYERKEDFQ